MTSALRPSALALFIGDIIFFIAALWLSLFLRAFAPPSGALFEAHLLAFTPLFFLWVLIFLIAGLYEGRRIILARRALSTTLLNAQIANVIIAALFFFLVPTFGISPKTVLAIYLIVSFLLILFWRAFLFPLLGLQKRDTALIIGAGREIDELVRALENAPLAPVSIEAVIAPGGAHKEDVEEALQKNLPTFVIADFESSGVEATLPDLYNLLTRGVRFIDARSLYEEVFGRVPLARVNDPWIARNVSRHVHVLYDPLKRAVDIIGALFLGIVSLILYPFIMLAIFFESGRPFFIVQERVGEGDRVVRLYKFRTMNGNDDGKYGGGKTSLEVTKVGTLLRATRLDELPQLWNILFGDLSLIGPRPELPSLVAQYEKVIPYYGLRHLIRPGLSGWAQLYHDNHPHHGTDVEATREKLSYDLYYLQHRSLILDILIALKTIAKMLTRSGV
ncbi:MAG: sugar transferase [Patescibacteria group bacterium]|nr:sugar transferase [Patescibacteria group bacterium]